MKNLKVEELNKGIQKINDENLYLKKEYAILEADFQTIKNNWLFSNEKLLLEEKIECLESQNNSMKSKIIDLEKGQMEQSQNFKLQEQNLEIVTENQKLRKEIETLNCKLGQRHNESQDQKEIIKVLQEDINILDVIKKKYKERLNSLEEMVASYYNRNEVNFL